MTGDQDDIKRRIASLLPPWFGAGDNPLRDGLLNGAAWALAQVYDLYAYAKLQTRIATATEAWLDLISADFFGSSLPRKAAEVDASFRARILLNLFREKATRHALSETLLKLTGTRPIIFEPARPLDTGAYNSPIWGYRARGGYGTLLAPFNAFVTVYMPPSSGIPLVAGYGIPAGGYNMNSRADYATLADIEATVTIDDVYDAVKAVRPVATQVWVKNAGPAPSGLLALTTEDGQPITTETAGTLFV
jgi:hypothetical protein